MKKIFLFILSTALYSRVLSQDNIILKNGDEIPATITEITINEVKYKKWKFKDGPGYTILKNEVFMIVYRNGTKDVFKENENVPIIPINKNHFKQKGFSNISELILTSYNNWYNIGSFINSQKIAFQTVTGYQLNSNFNLGLGLGIDYRKYLSYGTGYFPNYVQSSIFPMFIDFRINFLKRRFSPFVTFSGGYSIFHNYDLGNNMENTLKGGLLLSSAVGLKAFVSNKIALNFSIGYRIQQYSYWFSDPGNYNPGNLIIGWNKGNWNYIDIKTGITF
jgi:hypothetical protein